jgi:hypothetical protein
MMKLSEINSEDVLSAIKESLDGLISLTSGYEEDDVTVQMGTSEKIKDSLLVMVYVNEKLVSRLVFDLDFLRSTDNLLGSGGVLDYIK